jgi:3',5'-cyclic AMP phosphodiesterase CpdA
MRSLRHLRTSLLLAFTAALALAWSALPPTLTRGPFLQSVHRRGATLVFRTGASAPATVRVGPWPGPPWELELAVPDGTLHEVVLDRLRTDTRYHYEIEVGGQVLAAAEDCWFRTAPEENSRRPFRFLAFGDSGTGNSLQLEVAARMEEVRPRPDFAIGLGDLVYPSGEPENFDPRLFQPYARLLRTTPFWVTIGNHDAATAGGAPFLDAFTMPTDTGAPGHPSGTELYYSFDHGMAHFTCVDSQVSSHAVGGAMYSWIQDDLDDARARGKRWLIVFMHHPPYTKGTHDSDVENGLITLRQDLVPLFESRGVDLVMAGHSHVYERSYLAAGDAVLQGDPETYTKYGSPDGTLYLVSGCAGQSGSGPLNHPLMARSLGNVEGHNVIDVTHDEIRGFFVQRSGATTDVFSLRKTPDTRPPRIAHLEATGATELRLTYDEPVLGGSSGAGAAATANYSIHPPVSVLSATLLSDRRTVVLGLGSALPDVARRLSVSQVQDASGNLGSAEGLFVFPDPAPPPDFQAPRPVLAVDRHTASAPALIHLDASGSSDDGTVVQTTWDLGDGSPPVDATEVQHQYSTPGLYTVSLIVRDDQGLAALATETVRVHDQGSDPVIDVVTGPTQIRPGESVDFDARGCSDPDGGTLYTTWDFGDPSVGLPNHSVFPAARHFFQSPGTYRVSLTVADEEGSSVGTTVAVEVEAPPDENPSSSSGGGCAGVTSSSPWSGDASFPLLLAAVFVVLLARRRRPDRAPHATA